MGHITKTIPAGSPYRHLNNDIGTVTDVVGNTFKVSDIRVSDIANTIGSSSRNIGVLSSSDNINMYALFRPNKQPPYRFGDWAGYNHQAVAPTHYLTKTSTQIFNLDDNNEIEIPIQLNRGERPPSLDTDGCTWDYVKVQISNVGGSVEINEYLVANAIGESNGSYTPSHLIKVRFPSNDPYSVTVSVQAYYSTSSGTNIKPIEDTHPNMVLTIKPKYNYITISTSSYIQLSQIQHHYIYGSNPPYVIDASNTDIRVDNVSAPSSVIFTTAFRDSIANTISSGGYTYQYSYSSYWDSSANVRRILTFNKEGDLSAGSTYKKGSFWYYVNSVQDGYLASRVY
jgi:hypothetical protein